MWIRVLKCLALTCSFILMFKVSSLLAAGPQVSSKYYCLLDRQTGQTITARNANIPRPVASTTKIMTAILAVEYADLGETAVVSKYADNTAEYTIGLKEGQKISVEELLKAALIRSANDAAVVLAEYVAGDERFFAYLMSKKAFVIGAMRTEFRNASGLPDKEHLSTAYDLAVIGRYALSKPFVSRMVSTDSIKFKHPGYREPLTIHNTNSLIGSYPGADGIKTGTTDAAGNCLVASASRKNRGLIAVVLKSADRSGDCARLLDYGFNNTVRTLEVDKTEVFKNLKLNQAAQPYLTVYPAEDLWLWLGDPRPSIEKIIRIQYEIPAPVKKGYKIGEMDIYVDGCYTGSVNLVCGEDVDVQPGTVRKMLQKILYTLKRNKVSGIE